MPTKAGILLCAREDPSGIQEAMTKRVGAQRSEGPRGTVNYGGGGKESRLHASVCPASNMPGHERLENRLRGTQELEKEALAFATA